MNTNSSTPISVNIPGIDPGLTARVMPSSSFTSSISASIEVSGSSGSRVMSERNSITTTNNNNSSSNLGGFDSVSGTTAGLGATTTTATATTASSYTALHSSVKNLGDLSSSAAQNIKSVFANMGSNRK